MDCELCGKDLSQYEIKQKFHKKWYVKQNEEWKRIIPCEHCLLKLEEMNTNED